MDSIHLNHIMDSVEDASGQLFLCPDPPDIAGVSGDPEILSRIGDDYQVEIPLLIEKSYYLQLLRSPDEVETVDSPSHDIQKGLPIPLMWISEGTGHINHDVKEFLFEKNDSCDNGSVKSDSNSRIIVHSTSVVDLGSSNVLNHRVPEEASSACQQEETISILQLKDGWKGYCLVPGSTGESWTDVEEGSLLLGLYIFGKNLVEVQRFIESKKLGDVLSFYYGKFYRSDKYKRWSECRKMRNRRCIYGQKIFTGVRQQELLSRLLPPLSEENQNALLEVSKTFSEGKILLEKYVSSLKALVGMKNLIEAVGIGKGKQDLTGMSTEHLKPNQVVPVRPEIPTGKACSSLTTQEIVGFLTGDFRLSKARSSDLFWEAVWPRLLARGWHSEQPKHHICAPGSKQSLVFLVPGVRKFSRRKLVKGDQYFDSVTDVLSKVALEPGLLELDPEIDAGNGVVKEDNDLTNEAKLGQDCLSDQQRHCYLQPRAANHNANLVKITVVDTSLVSGENRKVREVRCLPVDNLEASTSGSLSEESGDDSCKEEVMHESDSANARSFKEEVIDSSGPTRLMHDSEVSPRKKMNRGLPITSPNSTNGNEKEQVRKDSPSSGYMITVPKKRRRLTACTRTEISNNTSSFFGGPKLKKEEHGGSGGGGGLLSYRPSVDFHSKVGSFQGKLPSTTSFSSKNSPIKSNKGKVGNVCFIVKHLHEEPPPKTTQINKGAFGSTLLTDKHPQTRPENENAAKPRTMFDLNLPVQLDAETDEAFVMEVRESRDDQTRTNSEDYRVSNACIGTSGSEQQPNMCSRRQSTRNRPLTTKALEALANGFLNIKQRRKRAAESSISRASRHARSKTENSGTDSVSSTVEEANGRCGGGSDAMFSHFQVQSESKRTQVSGP